MWWVASTKFLCALLETLTDVANALVHTSILVPGYNAIVNNLKIGPGPPYTLDSLTHINCYMDDVITAVQGRPKRQH